MDSGVCPVCELEFDGIEVIKRGQGEGPHLCLLTCGHEVVAMFPRGGGHRAAGMPARRPPTQLGVVS